jgi:hypothetical protein
MRRASASSAQRIFPHRAARSIAFPERVGHAPEAAALINNTPLWGGVPFPKCFKPEACRDHYSARDLIPHPITRHRAGPTPRRVG